MININIPAVAARPAGVPDATAEAELLAVTVDGPNGRVGEPDALWEDYGSDHMWPKDWSDPPPPPPKDQATRSGSRIRVPHANDGHHLTLPRQPTADRPSVISRTL